MTSPPAPPSLAFNASPMSEFASLANSPSIAVSHFVFEFELAPLIEGCCVAEIRRTRVICRDAANSHGEQPDQLVPLCLSGQHDLAKALWVHGVMLVEL